MRILFQAPWARAAAVIVAGLGTPWLAVHVYYEFSYWLPISWAWVQALGWVLDIAFQWIIVLALVKMLGNSWHTSIVGTGKWLDPSSMTKVFALLVLTGLSLDYLWQLPWFAIHPEKLAALSEPNSISFSDEEAVEAGPAILTTLLVLSAGPIVEEIFYRSLLLPSLMAMMSVGWSIAVSSILFGLYHLNDPLAASFFCAVLSFVYLRTGSLFSCIAIHIAYNLLQALLELLTLTFPDSWYRGYDLFRSEAWWLHGTILVVSTALLFNLARLRTYQSPPPPDRESSSGAL